MSTTLRPLLSTAIATSASTSTTTTTTTKGSVFRKRLNPKAIKRRIVPSVQEQAKDVRFYSIATRRADGLSRYNSSSYLRLRQSNESKMMMSREYSGCLEIHDDHGGDSASLEMSEKSFCSSSPSAHQTVERRDEISTSDIVKKLVCGGTAGFISRTLTAPVDRIRILMMTSAESLTIQGALATATATTTTSTGNSTNLMRLWIGNGVNCFKVAPEMSIKMLTFDWIVNHLTMQNNNSSNSKDPNDKTKNVSASERFVAGGLAGLIAQFSIYPMEVIKTKLAIAKPGQYSGMIDCIRDILSQSRAASSETGFGKYRGFYAGIVPSLIGILPFAAIDLSLNSMLKDMFVYNNNDQESNKDPNVLVLLLCGATSSGTATILTFPLNVIRTKAQATGESFDAVLSQLRAQGSWRAFYRGLIPCLVKVLPATSISYAAYDYLGHKWESGANNTR